MIISGVVGVVFTCMYLQNQPELSGKSPINGVFTRGNWSKNRGFSNQTCLIAGQSPNTVNQNQVKTEQFWFLCQRLPHKLQWQNQSHVSQTYNQIAWGWENLGLFCMGHSSWNWWKNRFQQSQSTRYFFGFKHSQAMGIKKPLWIPNYWVNLSSEQLI